MPTDAFFASDDAIAAIGHGLLDRSLPKAEWTHAAHFAATLWLLHTRPDLDLPREMPDIIRAYNLSLGGENTDTAGYHETITQASIRAARAVLAARPPQPLHVTCNALMESALGRSDWLLTYWSRPVLFSVAARRTWCPPDLRDLPF
jgi:hypothetical protein